MNSFMKKALSLLMVLCLVVLTVGLSVKVNAADTNVVVINQTNTLIEGWSVDTTNGGTVAKNGYYVIYGGAYIKSPEISTVPGGEINYTINIGSFGTFSANNYDMTICAYDANNAVASTSAVAKISEKYTEYSAEKNITGTITLNSDVSQFYLRVTSSSTSTNEKFARLFYLSFTYAEPSSSYTVNFDDGSGQIVSTQSDVPYDTKINAPNDPVKANYTFQGWYDGDKMWDFTTDTVKGNLTLTAKWVSNVLANLSVPLNNIKSYMSMGYRYSKIGGVNTDVLTADLFTATSTIYSNFTNVTDNSTAKYSGKTAKGNNVIQLRSSNSDSGIITIESGGFAKKITVDWNTNTSDGRTIDIYGKNTAYEATADLYDASKRGTKIGSIVKGTSTEQAISANYEYIGIRSSSGALYATSITIEWDNSSYSDVDFRIRCGIDSSISNAVSGLTGATYGIEVSDGTTTKKYLSTNTLYKNDSNGKDYVVISLGDVLNNPERLDKEFTVRAFVEYDGETVYSTATKTYSVVTLVNEYLKDTAVASQIEGFKNILEGFGKTFE